MPACSLSSFRLERALRRCLRASLWSCQHAGSLACAHAVAAGSLGDVLEAALRCGEPVAVGVGEELHRVCLHLKSCSMRRHRAGRGPGGHPGGGNRQHGGAQRRWRGQPVDRPVRAARRSRIEEQPDGGVREAYLVTPNRARRTGRARVTAWRGARGQGRGG